MRLPRRIGGPVLAMSVALLGADLLAQVPSRSGATFKSSVEVVTLSVVVRDRDGRLVPNLKVGDFEVLDNGVARRIVEFRSEAAPLRVALLFDVSGSMRVGDNVARARDAAHQVLGWLNHAGDEAALFAFDIELHELRPFEKPSSTAHKKAIAELRPFGQTSLRDAVAAAARRVTERGGPRRAVVVLSDGVDTSSELTAAEVSAAASAIDVPVYILATVSPVDHPGQEFAVDGDSRAISGELSDLARWTGGEFFMASLPAQVSLASRQIVAELRQQYLIAVEPDVKPGWHPLEVRTRNRRLTVRTRSGYVAGPSASKG